MTQDNKLMVLEIFFGHGSFSRVALEHGCKVIGLDIEPCPDDLQDKITFYQESILEWEYWRHVNPDAVDIAWFSPVCTTYSPGNFYRHRENCIAVTDLAKEHDEHVKRSLQILDYLQPKFGVIENPMGCLRKQGFIQHLDRQTVTYCQYGDTRQKKTDLFFYRRKPTTFEPKECKNGNPCHVPGPRGSKTPGSTQGLPKHLRARIPRPLCEDIFLAMRYDIENWNKQYWSESE